MGNSHTTTHTIDSRFTTEVCVCVGGNVGLGGSFGCCLGFHYGHISAGVGPERQA